MSQVTAPFIPYEGYEPFLFVSYAHADRATVFPELDRLHRLGYRIWYDRGIHTGAEWPEAIAAALKGCRQFVTFLSSAATASKNVRDEIHLALDHHKPMVVIRLDSAPLTGGLELRLGSIQAIRKHELSEEDYRARIRATLLPALVEQPWTSDRLDTGTILGVDFGTTNSVMAIRVGTEAEVILNREGEKSTPSVVAWTPDGEWLVGDAARAQAHRNYANTFYSVKTQLGRGFVVERGGKQYHAHDLVAMILRKLRTDASLYLRQEIRKVVVTHPVGFTHAQKEELVLAYQLAGFEVARVLSEPTAVALTYVRECPDQVVAIYDLGGGSFDVSIVDVDGVDHELVMCRAVDGDVELGGDNFDQFLADHCLARFEQENGIRVRNDLGVYRRVLDEAERVKKVLSGAPIAHVELPYLAFRNEQWFHLQMSVSAAAFIAMTAELVQRSIACCSKALAAAKMQAQQLDNVILVGLATKTPGLRAELRRFFGREPLCRVDPANAVALGAATQAVILETGGRGVLLIDVTPASVGVETQGGVMSVVIPKNAIIPNKKREKFRATKEVKDCLNINLFAGERPLASDNHYLGSLQFNRPGGWSEHSEVEVEVEYHVGGDITCSVTERGVSRSVRFSFAQRRENRDPDSRPPANLRLSVGE